MIELDSGRIHVRRAKNGVDSTHPLTGKEIRALRQLRRENLQSRFGKAGWWARPQADLLHCKPLHRTTPQGGFLDSENEFWPLLQKLG